ncbi:hypothetical protein F2P81_019131 [Scophthalmus maximus]|uniref:Uncharacterized protein n=1 Tax=Scophthalmus maximus TaxID=52904 RepID=A0A6A4SB63_SCOMX|nr:hypothetical protein F2P81_019131 [Scophthalmus maximus]
MRYGECAGVEYEMRNNFWCTVLFLPGCGECVEPGTGKTDRALRRARQCQCKGQRQILYIIFRKRRNAIAGSKPPLSMCFFPVGEQHQSEVSAMQLNGAQGPDIYLTIDSSILVNIISS